MLCFVMCILRLWCLRFCESVRWSSGLLLTISMCVIGGVWWCNGFVMLCFCVVCFVCLDFRCVLMGEMWLWFCIGMLLCVIFIVFMVCCSVVM